MLTKLSFQGKVFIYYSIVITLILSFLAFVFYSYIANFLVNRESKRMEQTVEKICLGLEQLVTQMDTVSTQVLSSKGIQEIMAEALEYKKQGDNFYDSSIKSKKDARDILFSINSIKSTARRIVIFNEYGNYLSIGKALEDTPPGINYFNNAPWYEELNKTYDRSAVIPPHKDSFLPEPDSPLVVSFIREMFSTFGWYEHLGYVEIQQPYSMVQSICETDKSSGLKTIILNAKGEMIYPYETIPESEKKYYLSLKDVNGKILRRPWDKTDELVYTKNLSNADWMVILVQSKSSFMSPVYKIQNIILFSGIVLIVLTLVIVFFITNSLTTPIREMRKSLKNLSVENLQIESGSQTNNEVVLLNTAFNQTLQRLKESMEQTIQARAGEAQANFLALQSQMNPHFLYNTLMLISSTGFEIGNNKIVTICSQLSKMLRYLASPETAGITIKDELIHAENYLNLLKWRFEDQLSFEFDIDERLYGILVPRLIIQPIIENSYAHGFSKIKPPWILKVKGWLEDDMWFIEVIDNGKGISDDNLCKIENRISVYKKQISSGRITNKLDIGGMGMVNIFIRLFMLYRDNTVFEIRNNAGTGAAVKLGGPHQKH